MAKTIFSEGSTMYPEFANAINNPKFSDNPSEDGEIPFPNTRASKYFVSPQNLFMNPSLCIPRNSGYSTIDASPSAGTVQTQCSGVYASLSETTYSGSFVVASGDPLVGFWFWPIVGAIASYEKITIGIDSDYINNGGVYTQYNYSKEIKEFYQTFQISVKNRNLTGKIIISLSDHYVENLIISGEAEFISESKDIVIPAGESTILKYSVKYNLKGTEFTSPTLSPLIEISYPDGAVTGTANAVELKNVGIFSGDFSEFDVPILSGDRFSSIEQFYCDDRDLVIFEQGSYFGTSTSGLQIVNYGSIHQVSFYVPFKRSKKNSLYDLDISEISFTGQFFDLTEVPQTETLSVYETEKNKEGFRVTFRGDVALSPAISSFAIFEIKFKYKASYQS